VRLRFPNGTVAVFERPIRILEALEIYARACPKRLRANAGFRIVSQTGKVTQEPLHPRIVDII
jgi:hypothetical protein